MLKLNWMWAAAARARTHRRVLWMSLLVLSVMLIASSAQAVYVDFADYRGLTGSNPATIDASGYSITISAKPASHDLTFTRAGIGVSCNGSWRHCWRNRPGQIGPGENVTITFNDGPVLLNNVELSRFYLGEKALVTTDDESRLVRGLGWRNRSNNRLVDMGGILVSELTVTSRGWFSDVALRSIDFSLTGAVSGDPNGGGPSGAVPEPGAALLFGAGMLLTAVRRKRS